ncbi:hypothetical protein BC831DRAFT_459268 [Entophlyctis helioformis]|nr:hypothetical protein BC831DRAFT_459268 [Entophlyctis helioformis]
MAETAPDALDRPLLLGLDTTLWAHVALFAADLLACAQHPSVTEGGLYVYKTHPVRQVRLSGIVVSVSRTRLCTEYAWLDRDRPEPEPFKLGDLVLVLGVLSDYRDRRQIVVSLMQAICDPNAEAAEWLDVLSLKADVYDRPLVVPPDLARAVLQAHGSGDNLGDVQAQDPTTTAAATTTTDMAGCIEAIRAYVESLPPDALIAFSSAVKQPSLRSAAASLISSRGPQPAAAAPAAPATSPVSDNMIAKTLGRGFTSLVQQGVLYLADEDTDTYARITHAGDLAPSIVRAVKGGSGRSGSSSGVPEDLIVLRLRESRKFQRVPRRAILESVQQLVADAVLFETDRGVYCAL